MTPGMERRLREAVDGRARGSSMDTTWLRLRQLGWVVIPDFRAGRRVHEHAVTDRGRAELARLDADRALAS